MHEKTAMRGRTTFFIMHFDKKSRNVEKKDEMSRVISDIL